MKQFITFYILLFNLFSTDIQAQQPSVLWQKCIGGTAVDAGFRLVENSDHHFLVTSSCNSANGNLNANLGFGDALLFMLDASGNLLQSTSWSGSGSDAISTIVNTNDGGYITAGTTASNDYKILGNHGGGDILVVKADAQFNVEWQRCLGGPGIDEVRTIIQTNDGGYFLAGGSQSNYGDINISKGDWDAWVIKLNNCGQIEWQKSLGGPGIDYLYGGVEDDNGDFGVAGLTTSNSGDVAGNHGSWDYWVLKLNASGTVIWQKCFGGSGQDESRGIELAADGGYLVNGFSSSTNGNITGNHGGRDMWVIKVNHNGDLAWERSLGGSDEETGFNVFETPQGNFVALGQTASDDGDVSGNHGAKDSWLVQFDTDGNINWQLCLGGSQDDDLRFVTLAADGDYILSGSTLSNDGDISGNHGNRDIWMVKLTGISGLVGNDNHKEALLIYPNPTNGIIYLPGYAGNMFVYASDGKVVSVVKNIESLKQVDLSKLPAGNYTLRLLDKDKEYRGKITKQ